MIWGQGVPVPALGFWKAVILALVLGQIALRYLRHRPRALGAAVVSLAVLLPVAARAVPLLTFTNGTTADADQVNANFAALQTTTTRIRYTDANLEISPPQSPYDVPLRFVGPTATVTTTDEQRITAAISISFSFRSPTAAFREGLCYRAAGTSDPPLSFDATTFGTTPTELTSAGSVTWTAVDTHVPGAGTWEVGRCLQYYGTSFFYITDLVGWVQVGPK
jgi:hypothetical protein